MSFFSVIIPTYNRAEKAVRAIRSVLRQRHGDYEIIVIDDGSTDDTMTRLREFGSSIRCQYQRNTGVSAARNRGITIAGGRYIAFLDSDDEWLPEKLEEHRRYIESNPGCRIHQTDEIWVRNGRRVNPKIRHLKRAGMIFKDSLELCLISPSAVAIEKSLLDETGLFDERLPVCEDYDLWLRITALEPVGLIEKKLLIRYGGHDDQLSYRHWGMDRFRAYSIAKLLATGSEKLRDDFRESAGKMLTEKLSILAEGAMKRSKRDFEASLREIILLAGKGLYSSIDYRSLLEE